MPRRPRQGSWIAAVLALLLTGGFLAGGAMLKYAFGAPWHDWRALLQGAFLLLVAGLYLGTIIVLDGSVARGQADRPVVRTLLCGALAVLGVLLVLARPLHEIDPLALAAAFMLGGMLGYFGGSWVGYVDL